MDKQKQDIIESTINAFQEKGLNFSLEDILSSANTSLETFQNYFSDEEDLLSQALEYAFIHIQEEKTKILRSNLSTKEKLKAVLVALPPEYEFIDYTLFHNLHARYPKVFAILQESLRADWEPIVEVLNQGIIDEEIKPISIPLFQAIFTSAIETLLSTDVLAENKLSYVHALQQLNTILIDGIGADD